MLSVGSSRHLLPNGDRLSDLTGHLTHDLSELHRAKVPLTLPVVRGRHSIIFSGSNQVSWTENSIQRKLMWVINNQHCSRKSKLPIRQSAMWSKGEKNIILQQLPTHDFLMHFPSWGRKPFGGGKKRVLKQLRLRKSQLFCNCNVSSSVHKFLKSFLAKSKNKIH